MLAICDVTRPLWVDKRLRGVAANNGWTINLLAHSPNKVAVYARDGEQRNVSELIIPFERAQRIALLIARFLL